MVTVCSSDSRALGPPRGWCRGEGLKNFVRFGAGGGETLRVTVDGTLRGFTPTFEVQRDVVENVRMHCPGMRPGSIARLTIFVGESPT